MSEEKKDLPGLVQGGLATFRDGLKVVTSLIEAGDQAFSAVDGALGGRALFEAPDLSRASDALAGLKVEAMVNQGQRGEAETSQLSAGGKACIPCSADHFSTVAGALSEALRFARSGGVKDPEAQRRIALSFDELNIMERIDAAPDLVAGLPQQERQLMNDASIKSRDLRHALSDISSVDSLERAAALAKTTATDFRKSLFRLRSARVLSEIHSNPPRPPAPVRDGKAVESPPTPKTRRRKKKDRPDGSH